MYSQKTIERFEHLDVLMNELTFYRDKITTSSLQKEEIAQYSALLNKISEIIIELGKE
jgi:hypothetical protein